LYVVCPPEAHVLKTWFPVKHCWDTEMLFFGWNLARSYSTAWVMPLALFALV
jgi:hypothetical protein